MLYSTRVEIPGPGDVTTTVDALDERTWAADEVWLRTRYSLISAGTELAAFVDSTGAQRYPTFPGYCAVGEVIKAGTEFPDVREGDLVFSYTGHEQIARARRLCVKVPNGIEPSYAAFVRMATVAMTAVRVSNVELGDWAAVVGQGAVGIMCAQLLQLSGADTVGIDLAAGRLSLARACAVRHTVSAAPGVHHVVEAVMALTGGRGTHTTVEAIGNPRTIQLCARLTGRLGEVILLGSPRGEHAADVTEVLNYVHLWENGCLTLKGAHEWRYPVLAGGDGRLRDTSPKHSIERNTDIAFRLMADGRLRYRPLRTHLLPPDCAREAYEGLRDRKDEYAGVVFDWTSL